MSEARATLLSADPYQLEIVIPRLPRLQSRQVHYRRARREDAQWKSDVFQLIGAVHRPREPLDRARIVCERWSSREPDHDNLGVSFKPVIDGLILARVIVDDRPSLLGDPPAYVWEPRPGRGSIRVVVTERPS